MIDNTFLKIDEESRIFIQEISALSGYSQTVIKEIIEYFLINWAIKIADNPDKLTELSIPYIGRIKIKYEGDRLLPTGEITTDVISELDLNPSFKRLVGDLHDEAKTEIEDALRRKIDTAVLIASSD